MPSSVWAHSNYIAHVRRLQVPAETAIARAFPTGSALSIKRALAATTAAYVCRILFRSPKKKPVAELSCGAKKSASSLLIQQYPNVVLNANCVLLTLSQQSKSSWRGPISHST